MDYKNKYLKYKSKYLNLKQTGGGPSEIPKVIYVFWHSSNLPFFIKRCMHNIKTKNPDYILKLYNKDDVMKIKDRPKILEEYNKRGVSDWFRLYMLKNYGGVYIDISCYFNKKNLNDVIDKYSDKLQGFRPPWEKEEIDTLLENWFLASKKNNPLVEAWLKEWEIALENKEKYVEKNIVYASKNLKPGLPYLTQHLTFQKIMKTTDLKKHLKSLGQADDINNPFYFMKMNNYDYSKYGLAEYLLYEKKLNDNLLFIKIVDRDRDKILENIKECKFSKDAQFVKDLNIKCMKHK